MSRPWEDTIYFTGISNSGEYASIVRLKEGIQNPGTDLSNKILSQQNYYIPNIAKQFFDENYQNAEWLTALKANLAGMATVLLQNDYYTLEDNIQIDKHRAADYLLNLLINNVFLNIKEIFYLVKSKGGDTEFWEWERLTEENFNMIRQSNPPKHLICKLDVSEELKEVLIGIGYEDFIKSSGCPAHHDHSEPQNKYFILSNFGDRQDFISQSQDYFSNSEGDQEIVFTPEFKNLNVDIEILSEDNNVAAFSHTHTMVLNSNFLSGMILESNSDFVTETTNQIPSEVEAVLGGLSDSSSGLPQISIGTGYV